MTYVGLDIGTSSCKAVAMDEHGQVLNVSSRAYGLETSYPGWVELEPERIWNALVAVLRGIAPSLKPGDALSIAGIGESFVLLDEQDRPLNRFITYLDQRCDGYLDNLRNCIPGEELYSITGLTPHTVYSLPRMLWIRDNNLRVWENAKAIVLFSEYYNFRLTGIRLVDYTTASRTMLFDVEKRDWSARLMDIWRIPKEKFAPVAPMGTYIGTVLPTVTHEAGLPQGIKVYLGCHDQIAASLGAGIVEIGETMAGEGSSESINVVTDASIWKHAEVLRKHQICLEPYLTPNRFLLPVGILSFGTSLRWYVRTLESALDREYGGDVYSHLDAQCASKTELVFLPYLSRVSIMDANTQALGAFLGINVSTSRAEMYRAVLEGLHFESRSNLSLLKEMGIFVDKLVATGGMARSPLSMQMKADIIERKIYTLDNDEAGARGLAILLAVCRGECGSYQEAVKRFVHYREVFVPQKDYSKKYEAYCHFSKGVKALYNDF